MKAFVLVSDFDGTLTEKDFYQMIIDDYLGEMGIAIYEAWKRKEYKDEEFLNKIYGALDMDEKELMAYILTIQWDQHANYVIQKIRENGGEFVIISAGSSYYIQPVLEKEKIDEVKVYSIPGSYKNRGLFLEIDQESCYYSDQYGIDKVKIVKELKEQYEKVYYAGDSMLDMEACILSDVIFAKGKLQALLEDRGIKYIAIDNYKDIEKYFIECGIIKEELERA